MPLVQITARLGQNATNDTILTTFANKTLKDVFRQSLLLEFASHPPAIAPINDKYEPALSHALNLGIIDLTDLGLPANGITLQDYLNGHKPAIEVHNLETRNKSNILFKELNNSKIVYSGQNSVNVTVPTYVYIIYQLILYISTNLYNFSPNFIIVLKITILFSLFGFYFLGILVVLASFFISADFGLAFSVRVFLSALVLVLVIVFCYWGSVPAVRYFKNLRPN